MRRENAFKLKMLLLSLTGECNFSCVYCYASNFPNNAMSFETAKKAVDLTAENSDYFVLQFSGGEPLLTFDLLKKITLYIKEKNIPAKLQLQTNASLLTEEIAKFLYSHKIGIGISLDGRPAVNNRLRLLKNGQGATNAIIHGVNVLKKMGIAAGITCVVTKENVGELSGIVEMAYYLGNIRKIGFDLLRCQGRGDNLDIPSKEEMEKAVRHAHELAWKLSRHTGLLLSFGHVERVKQLQNGIISCFGHCHAMNGEAIFVDVDGKIYACASIPRTDEFYLGDIETGVEAERLENVKSLMKKSMDFCFHCPHFNLCGGGCYSRWHSAGLEEPVGAECALKICSIEFFQKVKL